MFSVPLPLSGSVVAPATKSTLRFYSITNREAPCRGFPLYFVPPTLHQWGKN